MSLQKQILRQQLLSSLGSISKVDRSTISNLVCRQAFAAVPWHASVRVLSFTALIPEIDPTALHDLLAGKGIRVDKVSTHPDAGLPTTLYDVIVLPVIGYTNENYRLGRGGGWYDQLLAAQPHAVTIGLAYQRGKVVFAPEPHDKALTHIIAA